MAQSDDPKPDFSKRVPLASIPDGGILAGVVGEKAVLLTRSGNEVRAFSGICTHLGAPLEQGICVQGQVRCPWHHARFNLMTGEAVTAPAFDALKSWAVDRVGDEVVITAETSRGSSLQKRGFEGHSEPGFVILGGGAAGYAAAHELRCRGHEGPVTLVSEDESPPYDRTLLTKDYLDGKFGADRLPIAKTSLDDLGITLLAATKAKSIDIAAHQLHLADGRALPYTKLLLATGAEPNRLQVAGAHLPHVRLLRSLADCRALLTRLTAGAKVVVIGSSFIGLEAAASIRSRGFDVAVVTSEAEPMRKVLGPALARAILSAHTGQGVMFRMRASVKAITDGAVHFADGSSLPADLVVLGIGVKPRIAIADAAGLKVNDGVVVDQFLRTSDPDIYAAGDIARWPDPRSGRVRVEHWVVAERQGQIAARNMMGEAETYAAIPFFWSKHFDMSFRYLGHAEEWDEEAIEGNLDERDAVVRLRKKGEDQAVITVGRDRQALEFEERWEANAGR